MEVLRNLTTAEKELMYDTPVLVTILIAGADNDIDNAEIKKGVELTHDKKITAREDLLEYYRVVGEGFEDKLKVKIHQLPLDSQKRNQLIVDDLHKLNDILPKLPLEFAIDFYWSIRGLAKKIASASGGVLGYMAVGFEESKLLGLDMIHNPGE
jgi:hypothetical protein